MITIILVIVICHVNDQYLSIYSLGDSLVSALLEVGTSQNQSSFNSRELQAEGGKVNSLPSSLSIGVLQEIGQRCSSKVLEMNFRIELSLSFFIFVFVIIIFC